MAVLRPRLFLFRSSVVPSSLAVFGFNRGQPLGILLKRRLSIRPSVSGVPWFRNRVFGRSRVEMRSRRVAWPQPNDWHSEERGTWMQRRTWRWPRGPSDVSASWVPRPAATHTSGRGEGPEQTPSFSEGHGALSPRWLREHSSRSGCERARFRGSQPPSWWHWEQQPQEAHPGALHGILWSPFSKQKKKKKRREAERNLDKATEGGLTSLRRQTSQTSAAEAAPAFDSSGSSGPRERQRRDPSPADGKDAGFLPADANGRPDCV